MKQNKMQNLIVILLFALLLGFPLIRLDVWGGEVSTTENRQLAAFPVSIDDNTGKIKTGRTDVESWISDNIGL